jgi:hypothetical protein
MSGFAGSTPTGNKLVVKVEKTSSLFSTEECDVDFQVNVPKAVDLDLAVVSRFFVNQTFDASI